MVGGGLILLISFRIIRMPTPETQASEYFSYSLCWHPIKTRALLYITFPNLANAPAILIVKATTQCNVFATVLYLRLRGKCFSPYGYRQWQNCISVREKQAVLTRKM